MFAILTRPRVAAAAIMLVFTLLLAAFAIGIWTVAAGGSGLYLMLATFLPLPFYLWAIWTARSAILLIGAGGNLHSVLASMLNRIGAALFAGGVVRVFIVPWGIRLATGQGSYAVFDPAAITVGVVGVTLMIVARLVADAGEMRAELDEFL